MREFQPGKILRQYKVLEALGSGGFSVVYKVYDQTLDKLFAIKEYFPEQFAHRKGATVRANSNDADNFTWGKTRFIEEARVLSRFDHPNIVKVIQIFEANNTAYMVLEYLGGRNLKAWLTEIGNAPTQAELDSIVEPILNALELIHRNNLLHRDIAPDNIYIRDDGSPVLLDFGSAKEAIGQLTKTISAVVKDGYSPPEQYSTRTSGQGPWSDIYAFAATLYHAVTGARPEAATDRLLADDCVLAKQAAKEEYRPAFLDAIDFGLKLTQKNRPQSVAQWRVALFAENSAGGSDPMNCIDAIAPVISEGPQRPEELNVSKQQVSSQPIFDFKLLAAIGALCLLVVIGIITLSASKPSAVIDDKQVCANASGDTAISSCTRAIASGRYFGAELAQLHINRGGSYFKTGDDNRAIIDYNEGIRVSPNNFLAFNARANFYNDKNNYDQALQDYDRAIQLNSKNAVLFRNRGSAYLFKKDYNGAMRDFDQAIQLDPNYANAFNLRGFTYYSNGNYDRAIKDYDRAIQFNSKEAVVFSNRGNAHFSKKNYDQAIQDYDRAIEINPRNAVFFSNRGNVYLAKKDYSGAVRDFDQAIQLNPNYANAFNLRGIAYHNNSEYDRAIKDYDRTIQLSPKNAVLFRNRGNAYLAKKDYSGAVRDFDQAIQLNPNDAIAFNLRGNALYSRSDYARAVGDFSQAIQIDPKFARAFFNRGYAHWRNGDSNRAAADCGEARRIDPNTSWNASFC